VRMHVPIRMSPAILLAVSLAACGGAAPSSSPSSPAAAPASSAAAASKPAAASAAASTSAGAAASAKPAGSAAGAASAKPAASGSDAAKPAASASTGGTAAAKPAASGQLSLSIAYPSLTGASTPLWMADRLGLFAKHGLKADVKLIEGNVSTNSLVAKEIDVMLQSPTSVIVGNVNGKLNMEYVFSPYNHSQFSMMAESAIKSPADLKGKNVGTDRPGTSVDFQTRMLLSMMKLQPTDVQLRQLGLSNVLVPALLSGQLQAATLSIPDSFKVEPKGYHALADTYSIPYSGAGAVILKSRFDELAPALTALMQGYQDGIKAFYDQPDMAKQIMQEYLKESDPEILQRTYDFFKTARFQDDLQVNREGLQSIIDFIADTTLPEARQTKPDDYIDDRLLKQLPKS